MANVTLTRPDLNEPNDDIQSFSITEPGTPHDITNSRGSTGSASVTFRTEEDSYWSISEDATLAADGWAGTFDGQVSDVSVSPFFEDGSGGATTLTLSSKLTLLNAERTLPPMFEQTLNEVFETYVASITDELEVVWLASINPIRSYSTWHGNVWNILKTLCAAHRVEVAVSGSQLIVRDIGTQTLDITDAANVRITITSGSGQNVDITYRDSKAIDNQASVNYFENSSVETNADGYFVIMGASGSTTSGRVSN